MPAVELDADLIPGTSAAGWPIGARLADCGNLVCGANEIEYHPGFPLVKAINRNTGVLVIRNYGPDGFGPTVVYGSGLVRLNFNAREELFEVSVREGYRGRAFGRISIGSSIDDVRAMFAVFYDSGDEVYYPDTELSPGAPSGISFYASEEEQPGGTPILGISVHDWDLLRRSL